MFFVAGVQVHRHFTGSTVLPAVESTRGTWPSDLLSTALPPTSRTSSIHSHVYAKHGQLHVVLWPSPPRTTTTLRLPLHTTATSQDDDSKTTTDKTTTEMFGLWHCISRDGIHLLLDISKYINPENNWLLVLRLSLLLSSLLLLFLVKSFKLSFDGRVKCFININIIFISVQLQVALVTSTHTHTQPFCTPTAVQM